MRTYFNNNQTAKLDSDRRRQAVGDWKKRRCPQTGKEDELREGQQERERRMWGPATRVEGAGGGGSGMAVAWAGVERTGKGERCGFENVVVLMGLGVYFIKYDFFKITTSLIFNEREFSSNWSNLTANLTVSHYNWFLLIY